MTTTRTDLSRQRISAFIPGSPTRPATGPDDFPVPHPTTGTEDDDDDPSGEHSGEKEASERAVNEDTEAPEEFEIDDEDESGHAEDDNADEEDENAGD